MAAGKHTATLTVVGGTCVFDFVQAAVLSDPVAPHELLGGELRV